MKKYLIIFLAALGACQDKDDPALVVDPFIGSWVYDNASISLHVEFTTTAGARGQYQFKDINVDYTGIADDATFSAQIPDKLESEIRLNGNWSGKSASVYMTFNTIVKEGMGYVMNVGVLTIGTSNQDPLILQNQVFTRN